MTSLSDRHLHELTIESAIAPKIIEERGAYTASTAAGVPAMFAEYQRRPGLVFPVRDVTGEIATSQLKADEPRRDTNGKPLKYDTVTGGRMCLDVPLRSRPHLGDPSKELWITEGVKKVDSGLSHGVECIIGLLGVYGWRGTNEHGGKTALPDWESIALNGRTVIIAYDSDVMTKKDVRDALERLSAFLKSKGARVRYCLMPDLPNGDKCGLDDWFAAGHTLYELRGHVVGALPRMEPEVATPASVRPVYRRMSDVAPRRVDQLWTGYMVARKLNLLAGVGGVGKDQMMMNIIARLSTGRPLPGEDTGIMRRTLILAAEDDAHEDIRIRLDANGADVDNIFILDGVAVEDEELQWVDVRRHLPAIDQIVADENIELLYISPLSAYMPGIKRQDAGRVRDTLGHIQRLIDRTNLTVVGAVHLGKASLDRQGAMKILDSVEFVNAARNVLGINDLPDEHQPEDVLEDPTRGRRRVLEVVKSNSTIPGQPLVFSRPLDAAVKWHGTSPIGFDESFRPSDASARESRQAEAETWLAEFLTHGGRPQQEVAEAAKGHGISESTLNRAKRALDVKSRKVSGDGPWFWTLPSDQLGQADQDDQTQTLAPLDPLVPLVNNGSTPNGVSGRYIHQGNQEGQEDQGDHPQHRDPLGIIPRSSTGGELCPRGTDDEDWRYI